MEEKEDSPDKMYLTYYLTNCNNILEESQGSEIIGVVPFIVIRVSYNDMFGQTYEKYYKIFGKEYSIQELNSGESVVGTPKVKETLDTDPDVSFTSGSPIPISSIEGFRYFLRYEKTPHYGRKEICSVISRTFLNNK